MALSHDGFTFFNHPHSLVTRNQQPEPQVSVRQVFGVEGEFHILGERMGSDLSCRLTLDGYSSLTLLQNNLDIIQKQAPKLTGDLKQITSLGGQVTFKDCTFLGAQPIGKPFPDGSGVNGWVHFVILHWRARSPNS